VNDCLFFSPDHSPSPLDCAIRNNASLEVIKFLLDKGADMTLTTEEMALTSLGRAVETQRLDVVQLLLERGVDDGKRSRCVCKGRTS
jgi:ankyrin repeat protein